MDDLPSREAHFKANPKVSGKDGGKTLNPHQLAIDGVTLLGRMENARETQISIGNDLKDNLVQADKFAAEFKKGVNMFIEKTGMQAPKEDQPELRAGYLTKMRNQLDLDRANIRSVIWPTGYTRDESRKNRKKGYRPEN